MSTAVSFLYFAYGSNMSSRRLCSANRAPSAVAIGAASIARHRLMFDKVSKDGSGKADCHCTEDQADTVYGGLFRIAESDTEALDRAEGATGANPGYRRIAVRVTSATESVEARTYIATMKKSGWLPYPWYTHHILVGAREFELPEDYVAQIARQPTQADTKPGRTEAELAIYAEPPLKK